MRAPASSQKFTVTDTQTLTGNNTTAVVPIFNVIGVVNITKLGGVVLTALGSNVTASYFRANDGSTQNNITLNTGTTLSAANAGSVIAKTALVASALTVKTATSAKIGEAGTANLPFFQEFEFQANPLAASNIEFVYTTTNTPTLGVIQFFVEYYPISPGAVITAL